MSVNDFDFRKPPPGTLEKRAASWLAEAAALAAQKWAGYLAFPAGLELLKSEVLSTAVALQRLPEGTVGFSLSSGGHPGAALLLSMSRPALLSLVGGTFGDIYNSLPPDRDLSPIEDSVADFLIQQLILQLLQDAWPAANRLELAVAARGVPKAICTLPATELIIQATLTYTGPFGAQPIFLMLPRTGMVEELARAGNDRKQVEPVDREHIESLVRDMPVDLSVILGSAQITLTELGSLQAGDVLVLGQKVTEPLQARVSGADKFQVWPGVVGRRQAIQIESTVAK